MLDMRKKASSRLTIREDFREIEVFVDEPVLGNSTPHLVGDATGQIHVVNSAILGRCMLKGLLGRSIPLQRSCWVKAILDFNRTHQYSTGIAD